MKNLFNFDYKETAIRNSDEKRTKSRFSVVRGEGGMVVHCKKKTYEIIPTTAVSNLGHAFIEKFPDMKVSTFTHRHGEVIGLNLELLKNKTGKVGDKSYNAVITIPNNGGGRGYLAILEKRTICDNGATRTIPLYDVKSIKIPHNLNYKTALRLMEEALVEFVNIIQYIDKTDEVLDGMIMDKYEARKHLNQWFFENEMPTSHKKDMTFDDFRLMLVENPEGIKTIDRYNHLMNCFKTELGYNEELGLNLSMYTVYASVTNYLSRRMEVSNSKAPAEVQSSRQAAKIKYFDKVLVEAAS